MCQQYGVMDDMLKLLAFLESAEQFLNEPCPPKPGERIFFGFRGEAFFSQVFFSHCLVE